MLDVICYASVKNTFLDVMKPYLDLSKKKISKWHEHEYRVKVENDWKISYCIYCIWPLPYSYHNRVHPALSSIFACYIKNKRC